MGDQDVASHHGHQRGQHGADVGDDDRNRQHPGGIGPHLGDRGGNKADDNEGDAEHDELVEHILQRYHHRHGAFRQDKSGYNADDDANQQL